jgi:hypothetical protein
MNTCVRYLVLGAVALIALGSPAQADMTFTKQRGGPGGGAFDIRCGAASYVSGITVHRGWWMDGITVHCGLIDINNLPSRFFAREVEPYNAPAHTGGRQSNGNNTDKLSCGSDHAVISLKVDPVVDIEDGPTLVGRIALICQGMNPPHGVVNSRWSVSTAPGFGHGGDHLRWPGAPDVACPAHQWAVGVYGRSGIYIDAIGLVCDGEFTGPAVASAPTPGQYFNPTTDSAGTGVDVCLNWGTGCGAPAADEFCRRQGFVGSIGHEIRNDSPPTLVLGDNVFCGGSFCDRFSSITCQ